MSRVLLGIAFVSLLGCAPSDALLTSLRKDLNRVRSTPDGQSIGVRGERDLRPLLGVPLATVRAKLGRPDCDSADGKSCFAETDLLYYFYKNPPYSVGGGPMLLIWSDGTGRCQKFQWGLLK